MGYNISNPDKISLEKEYKNILPQGSYFYYVLTPNSSDGFSFLKSLNIKLKSLIGDADLVVSVNSAQPKIDTN